MLDRSWRFASSWRDSCWRQAMSFAQRETSRTRSRSSVRGYLTSSSPTSTWPGCRGLSFSTWSASTSARYSSSPSAASTRIKSRKGYPRHDYCVKEERFRILRTPPKVSALRGGPSPRTVPPPVCNEPAPARWGGTSCKDCIRGFKIPRVSIGGGTKGGPPACIAGICFGS
jgi:hypothetical protein